MRFKLKYFSTHENIKGNAKSLWVRREDDNAAQYDVFLADDTDSVIASDWASDGFSLLKIRQALKRVYFVLRRLQMGLKMNVFKGKYVYIILHL